MIVWNLETASIAARFEAPGTLIHSVSYSKKGSIAALCGIEVCLPDTKSGQLKGAKPELRGGIARFGAQPDAIFVAPDQLTAGAMIGSFGLKKPGTPLLFEGGAGIISVMEVSRDGKLVISGYQTGMVRTWDARSGKQILRMEAHDGYVKSVAFSPDGKLALSGGHDGSIKLWHLATGVLILGSTASKNEYASWTPDVHFVTTPDFAWTIFSDFDAATNKFTPNDDFLDEAARPDLVISRLSEYLAK